MTKDEIINIVKEFLSTEPIRFSQQWEDELVNRLKFIRNINWISIGKTHGIMQDECLKFCIGWLLSKYPKSNAKDIVLEAYIKWRKSNFDGSKGVKSKNPELDALMQFTKWENIDEYLDEHRIEKLPYYESGYDKQDENDEENISSDSFFQDSVEVTSEKEITEEDCEEEVFYEDYSDESSTDIVIDQLPSEIVTNDKKEKIETAYLNDKRFAVIALNEAKNFYIIIRRKIEIKRFQPSYINQSFRLIKKGIANLTRKEFHHLENSTFYFKDRFNIAEFKSQMQLFD